MVRFFFQAEDGIRDVAVTGVQTCALPIYFKRHKLPFGRSRYFQYKAQLAANGLDGLVDGRSGGNRRELTAHAQGFIRGVHQENPQLSLRQIADRVESSCGIRVSRMTVSRCLRAVGLKGQWTLPVKADRKSVV